MLFTAENILLVGSILLFVSIIVGKTGYRFGVPALLLFLVVGMLFGSDGLGLQFHNAKEAQFIGMVALSIILFSGGMDTKFTEIKPILSPGIVLSTFGVLLTALFTGVFLALPDKRQRFVHVLPGAAGAACAWVIYSEIYSWYVNHIAKASALYGSLSVLLLMLLWLYACISILFYGALLNHALFDWKKKKEKPECSDM